MTVTGETRVHPEDLYTMTLCERVRKALAARRDLVATRR